MVFGKIMVLWSTDFFLEFEVDALFLELAVSGSIKAVEAGGTAGDVLFDFIGFGQNAELDHFLSEVSFIEWFFEDEFVELLELGEGEFFGKELEADGLVADFSAEPFAGELQDFFVIKSERRKIIEGKPGGIAGVGGSGGRMVDEVDEGEVGDGNDVLAWVAVWSADGGELFEVDVFQSGLLLKPASGTGVDVFAYPNEPAGDGPFVFEGREGALDKKDFEVFFIKSKDDAIGGEGRSRVFVSEAHGSYLSLKITL
jgi:hypothetical protein